MSPSQRMRAWGATVSAGHVVLGTLGWLLLGVPPVFFAGCAAVTLAVALLAAPLMRPRPDDGEGGGGGPAPPDGDEPPWWPEFERAFRATTPPTTPDRRDRRLLRRLRGRSD